MQFSIAKEMLLEPLRTVQSIIVSGDGILNHVYLQIENNKLKIIGTNSEAYLTATLPLTDTAESEGAVAVAPRMLLDFCKNLPPTSIINIHVESGRMKISTGRSKAIIQTLEADNYPLPAKNDATVAINIAPGVLSNLLNRVQFAADENDSRVFLRGVLIELEGDSISAVATDGRRLAYFVQGLTEETTVKISAIIPKKTVIEIVRLLKDNTKNIEEEVELIINTEHLQVTAGHYLLQSKLIEGSFPDYKRIIPKNNTNQLIINKTLMKEAIQRLKPFVHNKTKYIKFDLSANKVNLMAANQKNEEAQEALEAQYQGEPMEVALNIDYLSDVLSSISEEQLIIALLNPISSVAIYDFGRDDFNAVVSPIKL